MTLRIVPILSILLVFAPSGPTAQTRPQAPPQPVVTELISLLERRPDLRDRLSEAIRLAAVNDVDSLGAFYERVNQLVTWIPVQREVVPRVLGLHYIINQAPGDGLNTDPAFSDWMGHLAKAWGEFLDTPASVEGIEPFSSLPGFNLEDYMAGPSGWRTFNQFFARELRPGKRPIAAPEDETVIVSPADAIFMGARPIGERSTITVKGAEWRISDLLAGSPYADAFRGGIYAHSFLRITDYHRYHIPVGGVIKEVRNVHGRVFLDVVRNPDGSLSSANGDTYQFNQERGLVILESPAVGLVALVPVGMSLISSVVLTPEAGASLRKGEPFGYFQFGGSDIVMLFQESKVVLEAEAGKKYLQGQRIGRAEGGH